MMDFLARATALVGGTMVALRRFGAPRAQASTAGRSKPSTADGARTARAPRISRTSAPSDRFSA